MQTHATLAYCAIAPDEAMIAELTLSPCEYSNLQLCNHWLESLDYRRHTVAHWANERTFLHHRS